MTADEAPDADSSNPCCAKIRKRLSKLEENRNVLRQAVQILEQQTNILETENADLKKKLNQEQEKAELDKKAKEEGSGIIRKLEKEINDLKVEMTTYQEQEIKGQSKMLEDCISERDTQIKMLKDHLMKEKAKTDSEKKKVEAERKKAAEEKKLLEMEKRKIEDERKMVGVERKKAEELRISLERLKTEVDETKGRLIAEKAKTEEVNKLIGEEKKKTIKEKKHAELQREKAKELTRALEGQTKEARDAKTQVEQMKQLLEDEKRKNDELQKKLVDLMREQGPASGSQCSHDKKRNGDINVKAEIVKSLKQQLKFEKERLKYAKRMSKIEKSEKMFVSQQYHILRQDYIQLSHHLKMLGNELSHRTEGTLSLTKTDGSSDSLRFNLQNTTSCIAYSENDFHLGKCCKGSFHIPCSTRECSCFDGSRGGCISQFSGIKSLAKPVKTNSFRTKHQGSTVCSTSTRSDGELMCSQGVDTAFLATSSKLAEGFLNQRLKIPNVPHGDVRDVKNKMTVVEEEEIDINYVHNNLNGAQRIAAVYEGNKVSDEVISGGGSKRKKPDRLHPVKSFCDKANQIYPESVNKLYTGKDLMSTKVGFPASIDHQESGISEFTDSAGPLTEVQDDMCRRCCKRFRCADDKQKFLSVPQCGQGRINKSGNDCFMPPCFPNKSASISLKLNENNPSSRKEEVRLVNDDQANLAGFENIIRDNYMKLLVLDDEDEERRFREAIERPLSPTLPEIKFSEDRLKGEDHSYYLVEELLRKSGTEEDNSEPSGNFDVVDLEINSNKLKLMMPAAPCISAPEELKLNGVLPERDINNQEVMENNGHSFHHDNMYVGIGKVSDGRKQDVLKSTSDFASSVKKLQENLQTKSVGANLADTNAAPGLNAFSNSVTRERYQLHKSGDELLGTQVSEKHQIHHSNSKVQSRSDMCLSDSLHLQDPYGGNARLEGPTGYCVIFSDMEDGDNISRIVQARNTLASKSIRRSQMDCNIVEVLRSLKSIVELQPEEKACVLFSSISGSICDLLFAKSRSVRLRDILEFTKSFAKDIHKVISDEASSQLFLENFQSDLFLNLAEDFLIKRRIMICNQMEPEQSCYSVLSSRIHHLKGQNMFVTDMSARTDQLLAAAILSASVCAALDQIGFLVELSYGVLQSCKDDTVCNLLLLHVFAFASGERFFILEEYTYLANVVKSVVWMLERGHQPLLPCDSTSDLNINFSPCSQCPFSKEAISVETFATSLMDILQDFASAGSLSMSSLTSSSRAPTKGFPVVGKWDILGSECEASCVLFKFMDHSSDNSPNRALCYFADVVSAVELFGRYMGWNWTCGNLLQRLLAISKLCPSNEFSAAPVVLIGQLGRFGVDFGGYEQSEVSQLRCELSSLLETNMTGKSSPPNQLAIVGALVNLLPFSFKEIIDGCVDHSIGADDQSHQSELVKKWFSHLDIKMQFLASEFFRRENVKL